MEGDGDLIILGSGQIAHISWKDGFIKCEGYLYENSATRIVEESDLALGLTGWYLIWQTCIWHPIFKSPGGYPVDASHPNEFQNYGGWANER
jgi:hypothetical protein